MSLIRRIIGWPLHTYRLWKVERRTRRQIQHALNNGRYTDQPQPWRP